MRQGLIYPLALAAALAAGAGAHAQTAPGAAPTGAAGAVMEYDPSVAPAQTVYRPRDLATAGKLPIVAWGNGGCQANGGVPTRPFLLEVASHGYLIIAPAKPGAEPPPPPPGPRPPMGPPPAPQGPPPTVSENLIQAIDWAQRENGRAGSQYFGRLDTSKIAVMGYSCGGLQALEAAADPRVVTALVLNSGVLGGGVLLRGSGMTKAKLAKLHTPVIYVHGGPADIAYANAVSDFKDIEHVPVFMAETAAGHEGTYRQPNGGSFAKVATAWLNWRLKGDQAAAPTFTGAACALCADPAWKVSRKKID